MEDTKYKDMNLNPEAKKKKLMELAGCGDNSDNNDDEYKIVTIREMLKDKSISDLDPQMKL